MSVHANQSPDTIVAVSTPPGYSGIGVIRMSGPDSRSILETIFKPAVRHNEVPNRKGLYGTVVDPESHKVLDDGIALFMESPRSYTGEDVVELSLHGSPVILDMVLKMMVRLGARPATRGEFTRRAFLAGKIDLVQAEAVIDLIESTSPLGAEEARGRLNGSLSEQIQTVCCALKDIIAELEAHIDFDEDDEEQAPDPEPSIRLIFEKMKKIQGLGDLGRVKREGIRTAIVGKPNVGKSTLFNALLRTERAIVTPISGTTRDTLEELLVLGGAAVNLCDTAGIRKNPDPIENEGIRRTEKQILAADLVLVILDGTSEPDEEDAAVVMRCKGKRKVVVLNKMDLGLVVKGDEAAPGLERCPHVPVSAMTGEGLDSLREVLAQSVRAIASPTSGLSGGLNRRCLQLLEAAMIPIGQLLQSLAGPTPVAPEIVSLELRRAIGLLEEITGERTNEGILDRIFERFCVGK